MFTFLAVFCLVYGLIELFSGFTKVKFMMNIVKSSFGKGKEMDDQKAIRIMYASGAFLLVLSVVFFVLA